MAPRTMERDKDQPAKTKGRAKTARPYERPRGGPARAVGDLMPQIGRTAFRRFGFVQSSVVTRWPEIVGERHARVCAPEAIRFPPGEKADGILQLVLDICRGLVLPDHKAASKNPCKAIPVPPEPPQPRPAPDVEKPDAAA